MTDLPRRPIRPLLPPPGSFEHTVARARSRRRRALVGASSAGLAAVAVVAIVGATSLGHVGAQRDVRPVVPVVSSPPPSSAPPSSAPSASPTPAPTSAPPTPATAAPSSALLTTAPVSSPPPVVVSSPPPSAPASVPPPTYRGRLTDAAHHPLKGYYLYWYSPGVVTPADAPDELDLPNPAAKTRADGTFEVVCGPPNSSVLAISPTSFPRGSQSWLYSPINNQPDNEAGVFYTGGISILPAVNIGSSCGQDAPRKTTIYKPHGVVTGTVSVDGKLYSAADDARRAAAQPGDPGADLAIFVEINSPNGEIQMDEMLPVPGTGAFTLDGLGTGDVVFHVGSDTVKVPVIDGQSVKVAIAITMGSTEGSATGTVTVVP